MLSILSNKTGDLNTRGFKEKDYIKKDIVFKNVITFLTSLYEGIPESYPVHNEDGSYSMLALRDLALSKSAFVVDVYFLLKKSSIIFENYFIKKIPAFKKNNENIYKYNVESLVNLLNESLFEEELLLGFKIYFMLKTLSSHHKEINHKIRKYTKLQDIHFPFQTNFKKNLLRNNNFWFRLQFAWLFYYHNSANVQVSVKIHVEIDKFQFSNLITDNYHEENVQQKFYYPVHPACNYLPPSEKNRIELSIKRDNNQEKKTDFVRKKDELISLIDYINLTRINYKVSYHSIEYIRILALVISFIYNGLFLYAVDKEIIETHTNLVINEWVKVILRLLGLMHFVVSCLQVLFQGILKSKQVLERNWELKYRKFLNEMEEKSFIIISQNKESIVTKNKHKNFYEYTYTEKLQFMDEY